ncbi:MAG: GTPase Era [Candidatus Eisenbacteria sp.]|nr:GTPase Era [Candidatus Eisenbacteria bacterium]
MNDVRGEQGEGPGCSDAFHSGYVAICGYPNAGKSTLLNAILEQKLAIVTPKPQTTRHRTLGILTNERCQMIFIDTPGILDPRYDLQAAMMKQVGKSIADADVILYLADVRHPRLAPGVVVASRNKPTIILLNKADLLKRVEDALPIIEELRQQGEFVDFFAISALRGRGVHGMLGRVESLLPPGPHLYPADQLTEHPERFFVGELIREAIFDLFRQEVPYSTEVEVIEFRESEGKADHIEAIIYVESESQRGILIGKGGQAIKRLGSKARVSIEEFLSRPVFLGIKVKVMPNWRRDKRALRRFGY